jgi:GNAT superfamily N-acetyltransferase
MDIEVRLAGENDLDIINDILREIQECDADERGARFREALASNFSTYLLAVTDSRVIGFLNIWHLPDLVDGGFLGIILDCYVKGEYRRRGVGKMLLEAALDVGEKNKVSKYYVWIDPGNKSAVTLLKKSGFCAESLMLERK